MQVEGRTVGSAGVIAVSGDIDSHNVDQFRAAADAALKAASSLLVIDLTAVETLDSTALGALLDVRRAAALRDLDVSLVYDDPVVERIIEVAGLDDAFHRSTSVESAVSGY